MSVRHAVLSIGALLVLGLGVYLFVQVRAEPVASSPGAESTGTGDRIAARTESAAEPATEPAVERPPRFVPPVAAPTAPTTRSVMTPDPGPAVPTVAPAAPADDPTLAGPRLDAVMDEANKAYDRADYDDAKTIAARVLARQPGNVRMLRILVSASCIDGDGATAQTHFVKLPVGDQAQMRVRCARYGIALSDKPADKP